MSQSGGIVFPITVQIAAAGTLTGVIDLDPQGIGAHLVGIAMPAIWTAAGITFRSCNIMSSVSPGILIPFLPLDSQLQDVYDNAGNELSLIVVQNHMITIDPSIYCGFRYINIRSGTGSVPVAQAAARTLTLSTRVV